MTDADDAMRLYDQDRQRFLTIHREFLQNKTIPARSRLEEGKSTKSAIGQLNTLLNATDA